MDRRDFIRNSLVAAGYVLIGDRLVFADPVKDNKVKGVSLDITYVTEILKQPRKKDIKIWIPVPFNDHEQEISGFSVDSNAPFRVTEDPQWGNRMVFVAAETVKKGDKFILKYKVRRKTSGVIEDTKKKPEKFLTPSEWEKWDENIAKHVDSLVGNEKDSFKIAKKVYLDIISRMKYIHEVCGRGVSVITFEEKLGRCDEYHALFRSMMMYKQIPVIWEQGLMLPYPSEIKKEGEYEADCINAHSWASFYIGDGRWVPVDVSEAKRRPDLRDFYFGRLVPNRIKYSIGRGLTLNPPQKNIINTFAYAYIEAGGYPAIYGHNYRNRIKYKLIEIEI